MKKKKKKEKKEPREKKPRDFKALKKIMRVIVFLTVLFVMIRGFTSIFNNDALELQMLKEELNLLKEHPPEQVAKLPIVEGTAKTYLREYLTYTGDKTERERRLKDFALTIIDEQINADVISMMPTTVEVYETEKVNDKEVNVNLYTLVDVQRYGQEDPRTGEREVIKEKVSAYYRITVVLLEDGAIVKKVPIRLPELTNSEVIEYRVVNYGAPETKEKREIEESLKSFFKAYFEGSKKDISYVTVINDLRGLEGACEFIGIEKSDIRSNDQKEAFCSVILKVSDDYRQYSTEYEVKLIKDEDRYLVESFDITNTNFEEHYFKEEE